jgi:hypothetical protein
MAAASDPSDPRPKRMAAAMLMRLAAQKLQAKDYEGALDDLHWAATKDPAYVRANLEPFARIYEPKFGDAELWKSVRKVVH